MPDAADRSPERSSELLTTLLGDYWFGTTDHIPSAALAAVLREFGVGPEATRAALSRSTRRGRLEGSRSGRNTAYRLAPALREVATALGQAMMAVGAPSARWDGTWTCVAFSVAETDRQRRLALRTRLRALGFGALFDGVWISPRPPGRELGAVLHHLGITGAAVLRATEIPRHSRVDLLSAWDLDGLRQRYDRFVAHLDRVTPRIEAGACGSAEALVTRTELLVRWRELVTTDPGLPDELLPGDWPRAAARRGFVAAYDTLGPLAEARVRQLVAPDPATPLPCHHRVEDVLRRHRAP
ncbi:MAG TPA: PaaX family transcriptional regulator C-terminal domain-containing protein [Acidimicrobiales bacterium]|nr:PaaX family transcriptional regulator C-terminal domain-containing protein [Acidimicrobiales bacterium]